MLKTPLTPTYSMLMRLVNPACLVTLVVFAVATIAGISAVALGSIQFEVPSELEAYLELIPWSAIPVILPFLLVGALAFLRWPQITVYVLAFLLPFDAVGGIYFASPLMSLIKIAVNVFFVFSVISIAVAPPGWRRWLTSSYIGIFLSMFLVLLGLAGVIGLLMGYSQYEWLREFNWLAFYAFALPAGTFIRTRRQVGIVLVLTMLGALIYQGVGLSRLLTGIRFERAEDWSGGSDFIRVPFTEPMRFGLIWMLANVIKKGPRLWSGKFQRIGIISLMLLFSVGLLGSLARGLWLSTAAAFGVILLIGKSRQFIRVFLVVILVISISLLTINWLDNLSPYSSGRFLADAYDFMVALFTGKSTSSTVGRVVEWVNAIKLWLKSPIIGNGIGAPFDYTIYNPLDLASFFTHNSYLNILAKMGLVGFLVFAGLIVSTVSSAWRLLRPGNRNPFEHILALSLFAYVVAVLLHSIMAPAITATDTVMFFALIMGIIVSLNRNLLGHSKVNELGEKTQ